MSSLLPVVVIAVESSGFSSEPLNCMQEAGKIWEKIVESTAGALEALIPQAVKRQMCACVNSVQLNRRNRRKQALDYGECIHQEHSTGWAGRSPWEVRRRGWVEKMDCTVIYASKRSLSRRLTQICHTLKIHSRKQMGINNKRGILAYGVLWYVFKDHVMEYLGHALR